MKQITVTFTSEVETDEDAQALVVTLANRFNGTAIYVPQPALHVNGITFVASTDVADEPSLVTADA